MASQLVAFISALPVSVRPALLPSPHPRSRPVRRPRPSVVPRPSLSLAPPPRPSVPVPSPSPVPSASSHQHHPAPSRIRSLAVACLAALFPLLPHPAPAHTASLSAKPPPISTPFRRTTPSNARLAFVSVSRALVPTRADTLPNVVLKSFLFLGLLTALVIFAVISVMFVCQDAIVYKPTKTWRGNPAESGMPHYEDVNYTTRDGVHISGWFIRQPPHSFSSARTLVYFHGRDKNASFRLGKVVGLYDTCKCNILLISYRGFGLSTGKPNEHGMRIDAESAYDYLKSRGDVDVGPGGNLWVYGESLGGAVAVYFSKLYQHCINALILENTFTSLLDMAKLEFPLLGVFRYLSKNRWQSNKRIGDLGIPLLFLSGLKDAYIPPRMMKQMHSLATKSPLKEFVEFENGTHNRTWTIAGFYEAVDAFMHRVEHEILSRTGSPKKQEAETSAAASSSAGGVDDFGSFVPAS